MSKKTIKLRKPHTHAGRDYQPGNKLTLDSDSADWLISIGSAEEVAVEVAPAETVPKRK